MDHIKPCKLTIDLYNTFRTRMPEYVQYDRNIPLEITVLANGQPVDLTGKFARIQIGKPDNTFVYHDRVTIEGNIITTNFEEESFNIAGNVNVTIDILDEQRGKVALIPFIVRVKPAIITDESIQSSNDYQTITALIADVRALNETFNIEQGERAVIFEQSEADRKDQFDAQMRQWTETVDQAEATRQSNEDQRRSAEETRENAEEARENAEARRVDTEAERQHQEQERCQEEARRDTAEVGRSEAEQTRANDELSRRSAESDRKDAEASRVKAETSRVTAEANRASAEVNRTDAETRRSEAEANRASAEINRVNAESQRITAENIRGTQENARREAEENRATRMAQWESKAEEMAQRTQEAVDSAQEFINTNEDRLLDQQDRVDYMGNVHKTMRDTNNANVDHAIKTAIGEFNYLDYEGQRITATNSIEGHTKSAILKGCTLVNCIEIKGYATTTWPVINLENVLLQPNKKYIAILQYLPTDCQWAITNNGEQTTHVRYNKSMYAIFTSASTITNLLLLHINKGTQTDLTLEELKKVQPMIIEYQEGMENWDIPYFEGMTSVRMPVLKTTGSNIIKPFEEWKKGGSGATYTITGKRLEINTTAWNSRVEITQQLKPNTTYSVGWDAIENVAFRFSNTNRPTDSSPFKSFTTNESGKVTFTLKNSVQVCTMVIDGFRINEGDTDLGYEPYKSNILSTPSDLELGGIGDVQDTLDLLTGEVVVRTKEIILNGSESWAKSNNLDNVYRFYLLHNSVSPSTTPNGKLICNNLPVISLENVKNDLIHIGNAWGINIQLTKDKLSSFDVNEFKAWLSQNPVTVRYQLAEPVHKTVDLSDNVVYSYGSTTHYSCSSEEGSLVPTLNVKVPTDVQATIAQQRNTIQALESENEALKDGLIEANQYREDGDLELLSSDFDLDFRLTEIEFTIGAPMTIVFNATKSRSPYEMAKILILSGKYEYSDMEYKLGRYLSYGQITQEQHDELIGLMDTTN